MRGLQTLLKSIMDICPHQIPWARGVVECISNSHPLLPVGQVPQSIWTIRYLSHLHMEDLILHSPIQPLGMGSHGKGTLQQCGLIKWGMYNILWLCPPSHLGWVIRLRTPNIRLSCQPSLIGASQGWTTVHHKVGDLWFHQVYSNTPFIMSLVRLLSLNTQPTRILLSGLCCLHNP